MGCPESSRVIGVSNNSGKQVGVLQQTALVGLVLTNRCVVDCSTISRHLICFTRQFPSSANLAQIPEAVFGIGSSSEISQLRRA